MFLSVLIYGSLLWMMSKLSIKSFKTNTFKYMVYAALLFAFIFGIRYGVGRDYPAYLTNYLSYLKFGYSDAHDELGFDYYQRICAFLNFHPTIFFGIISFVEMYLLYYALRNRKYLLLPFTLIFFISAAWLPFSSGVRQAIAFCLFFLAVDYIDLKYWKNYLLLIFLAFMIHKSAIILLVFYPLLLIKKEWFSREKVQLLILFISIFLMLTHFAERLLGDFENILLLASESLSYDNYLDEQYADILYKKEEGIGLGQIIYIIIFSFCILYSNKVKEFFKDDYITRSYNLFFIGANMKFLFNGSNLFGRLTWYFEYFYLLIGACTLFYLLKTNKKMYYCFLFFNILLVIAILYKGNANFANYYFYWDKHQFELDHINMDIIKVSE